MTRNEAAASGYHDTAIQAAPGSQADGEEDVCEFFKAGYGSESDEMHWGRCEPAWTLHAPSTGRTPGARRHSTNQTWFVASIPQLLLHSRYGLCNVTIGSKWAARAAARCQDCVSDHNICASPPQLLIHQYLNRLDEDDWRGNLASVQAYLLTQVCTYTRRGVYTSSCIPSQ